MEFVTLLLWALGALCAIAILWTRSRKASYLWGFVLLIPAVVSMLWANELPGLRYYFMLFIAVTVGDTLRAWRDGSARTAKS